MPYYAAMATAGSVAGCLVLYVIARKGGDALIRRRFHGRTLDRATRLIQKYGVLTLVIPAILPPPAPFKLFVLLAGVSGVKPLPFAAVDCGRPGYALLRDRPPVGLVRPAGGDISRDARQVGRHRHRRADGGGSRRLDGPSRTTAGVSRL